MVEARDIQANAPNITGLANASEVVNWAYQAEVGDVSNMPFPIDGNYVIATLVRIKEAGAPPLEYVRDEMQAGAVKDKKAKMYMDIMKGSSLNEIAEQAGVQVSTAAGVSLKNPGINGTSGTESDVVGAAFVLPINAVSDPIQGANGVWVIAPMTRNEVDASGDFASQVSSLDNLAWRGAAAFGRLSQAISDKAEVEDLRQGS